MAMQPVSVTQLTQYIKLLLDRDEILSQVCVRGELSNYKAHSSGHQYFTLKDEGAVISCVMFRSDAAKLRFRPESGMKVILYGRVSLFPKSGQYQIYVTSLQPDGVGALAVAFEQLKRRLYQEGLFDPAHKKPLPVYPERVALVTSPTGAAVRDMIRILGRRWPMAQVLVCPVRVQGEGAAEEIAAMLDIDCHDRGADVAVNEEKFRAEMDRLIEELGADGPMAKYGRCAGTRQDLYLPAEDTGFPLDREALYEAVLAALRGEGGSVEAGYDYTAWLRARYGWMGDLHDCLEISIDNQYIWFYRNGLLLTECPVVTGDLATNSITRKGIFQIYGMVTDTNLKGPTWDDHVDYWMPFDGDIGIHDSSWRDEYGGDIYRDNGSHGCVNTPLESMGIIYDNSFYGLLVIVR